MAMLMPAAPFCASAFAPARSMLMMVMKSTTSYVTSMPTSFKYSWIASFIGSGTIWPPPPEARMIFALTGLLELNPASANSFFAAAGS